MKEREVAVNVFGGAQERRGPSLASIVVLTRPGKDFAEIEKAVYDEVPDDRQKLNELWFEGLRVWFPGGPDDPELALLTVEVEEAKYWTNAASVVTYAWAYVKAAVTHKSPSPSEIGDVKTVRF